MSKRSIQENEKRGPFVHYLRDEIEGWLEKAWVAETQTNKGTHNLNKVPNSY